MNAAARFLNKHGAIRAREVLDQLPAGFDYLSLEKQLVINIAEATKPSTPDFYNAWVNIPELARLVESHEMILVWRLPNSWREHEDDDQFGWHGAGMCLAMSKDDWPVEKVERFKQAMDDVWHCQQLDPKCDSK